MAEVQTLAIFVPDERLDGQDLSVAANCSGSFSGVYTPQI
jgi:hypothetical protein